MGQTERTKGVSGGLARVRIRRHRHKPVGPRSSIQRRPLVRSDDVEA
jgi:hypothetical protein